MRIDLKFTGIESVIHHLDKLSGPKAAEAYVKALNDTGFELRGKMRAEINRVFDRPSAFISKSPKVFPAKPDRLTVTVAPTKHSESTWQRGGKVGVDPQHVLQAQEWGGTRRDKRSEVRLRQAGILPAGYQTAIPSNPFPGSTDAYGNISGKFLQGLLSYLQAYQPGQGFKANMGKAAMGRVHQFGRSSISKRGQQQAGPFMGRRYFVAGTRLESRFEGGEHKLGPVMRKGTAHLPPGVWAAMGPYGQTIRPVLMFVRTPTYSPRLSMERVAASMNVEEFLAKKLRHRIRQAVETPGK